MRQRPPCAHLHTSDHAIFVQPPAVLSLNNDTVCGSRRARLAHCRRKGMSSKRHSSRRCGGGTLGAGLGAPCRVWGKLADRVGQPGRDTPVLHVVHNLRHVAVLLKAARLPVQPDLVARVGVQLDVVARAVRLAVRHECVVHPSRVWHLLLAQQRSASLTCSLAGRDACTSQRRALVEASLMACGHGVCMNAKRAHELWGDSRSGVAAFPHRLSAVQPGPGNWAALLGWKHGRHV